MERNLELEIADRLARMAVELNQIQGMLREERQRFVAIPKRDVNFQRLRELLDIIEE